MRYTGLPDEISLEKSNAIVHELILSAANFES